MTDLTVDVDTTHAVPGETRFRVYRHAALVGTITQRFSKKYGVKYEAEGDTFGGPRRLGADAPDTFASALDLFTIY